VETLERNAPLDVDLLHLQLVDVGAVVVLALAIADSSTFLMIRAPFFG